MAAALDEALTSGTDGLELGRLRARLLDEVLEAHFASACAGVGVAVAGAPLALAAAGSYGRGVMGLHSDVDVRLVVCGDGDVRALADALLYPLWDAGLSIGHQLAMPAELLELATGDLATATTLLDLRTVAGDPRSVRELAATFVARLETAGGAFVQALIEDTHKRHARYGDSVYLLEPDVKFGAGGLRDLEVARWLLTPRFVGKGDPLAALVDAGAVAQRDLDAAHAAEAFAWRVRSRLHALAGRRSDRLTFDAQETLARASGYVTGDPDMQEGTERFMQDHYVHARAISRVRDRAMSLVTRVATRKKPRDIGHGLAVVSDAVALGDLDSVTTDPVLALRAYDACVRLGLRIDDATRDAIARAASDPVACARLRASPEAAALFVGLVCTVAETPALGASIARELHDVGLLVAMIPEFQPVTGRVHHDVYHVLTVDVHSAAAVDCLHALVRGELANAHPLASRLAVEVARPRRLVLATLLHDIGKGHGAEHGRKNHSVSGAALCDVVLPRLGFGPSDTADARALVLHHLVMYHLATRRDLDDEGTIDELCRVVRGREGLRDLYLLTIADITTTSPTAMTSWKAHMLEELYLRADARLAGAAVHSSLAAIDAERLAAVSALVAKHDPNAAEFMASMPTRYVLATPPESIAAHAGIARGRTGSVAVGLGPAHPPLAFSEVCVVARDRPGLLARIAAALAASGLEVSAAHINTRAIAGAKADREAVDVFFVRDADGHEGVARKLAAVERDLALLCEDQLAASELVLSRLGTRPPWTTRKTPDVRTRVIFDPRSSPHSTIIEVVTKDEPGLLFRLAHALEASAVSIVLSKINTEGTKVADVFYVQELDGRKVEGNKRLEGIRERLIEATRWERLGACEKPSFF